MLALTAGVGSGGNLRDDIALINHNIGIVRLTKLMVPDMVARGSGRILLVSPAIAPLPHSLEAVSLEDVSAASRAYMHSFVGA